MKHSKSLYFILSAVLVMAAIGSVYSVINKNQQQIAKKETKTSEISNDIKTNTGECERYDPAIDIGQGYKLRTDIGENCRGDWDQQILKDDQVIINTVKGKIPELKEEFNLGLCKLASPKDLKLIFLQKCLLATETSGLAIFSFNVDSSDFSKLKSSSLFNTGNSQFFLSPNQSRLAWVKIDQTKNGDDKVMYLIDLLNDSYKKIIELNGKESLNGGSSDLYSHFEIAWPDDQTIQYSVFDQTLKPADLTLPDDDSFYSKIKIGQRTAHL